MAASQTKSSSAGGGQSPAPDNAQRALRVGIVLGGSIVEERLIRERTNVTVGQSVKNTFSIPVSGLPLKWPLFVEEGGRYALHITKRMEGRLSEGKKVRSFEELKQEGAAQKRGDHWVIPLSETSRGKVIAGDLTLLFQFVVPPPVQPRPHLPASVRGTFADRIDRRLAILLGISLSFHIGLMIWAFQHDQVVQSRIERLRGEFERQEYEARAIDTTFDMPKTPSEEDPRPTEEEGEAQAEESDPQPEPPQEQTADSEPAGGGAPTEAEIDEAIRDTAFLKVATGSAREGGRYGDMLETDQGADLDRAIDNVRRGGGRVEAGGSASERRTRGPEGGEIGTGSGPGVEGPGDGGGIDTDRQEEQIRSRANLSGGGETLDSTSLDPQSVARRIRSRYLRGIQRCHERVLRQDPEAGGRVELDFTVGRSGRVVRADVFGFNDVVDQCIEGLTRNWRFGVPQDRSGNPTEADFLIPLVLRPGG